MPRSSMQAKRLLEGIALLLSAQWPGGAFAGHPLLTEDTGTQGAGRYQLEITYDQSQDRDGAVKSRTGVLNGVFSWGLTEALDVIASLPYARLNERTGGPTMTERGLGDGEIAAKWRFYEAGALSFALRPGIGLPTGSKQKGLGSGRAVPSLFAVATHAGDPWTFHLHLGCSRTPPSAAERSPIYHASAAVEYGVNERLRLVGDASVERNADRTGHPRVGSVVLGLVYAVTPDLGLDLGYRKGLTDPAPDHAWLMGLSLRF